MAHFVTAPLRRFCEQILWFAPVGWRELGVHRWTWGLGRKTLSRVHIVSSRIWWRGGEGKCKFQVARALIPDNIVAHLRIQRMVAFEQGSRFPADKKGGGAHVRVLEIKPDNHHHLSNEMNFDLTPKNQKLHQNTTSSDRNLRLSLIFLPAHDAMDWIGLGLQSKQGLDVLLELHRPLSSPLGSRILNNSTAQTLISYRKKIESINKNSSHAKQRNHHFCKKSIYIYTYIKSCTSGTDLDTKTQRLREDWGV